MGQVKRIKRIVVLFFVFIFLMTIKFFVLGVVRGDEFEDAAMRQKISGSTMSKARGIIYDKNMIPLTNRSTETLVCLIPDEFKDNKEDIKEIADICNIKQPTALAYVERNLPIFLEVNDEQRQQLAKFEDKLSFIITTSRYGESSVAAHVTGYLRGADGIGEIGFEKYYDEDISSDSRKAVVAVSDAKNQVLKGFGYVLTDRGVSDKPLNVVSTLDYKIQKICEDVLKDKNVPGAIVVQDTNNGDILAMASSPTFDQNNVADYLSSDNNELINKATSAYSVGSVFKLVLAAKSLEMGSDLNYSYYCNGVYELDSLQFLCHTYRHGGHGILDLHGAFAQSCNTYFIDLGIELGMKNIVETATKLGLGQKTGLEEQGVSESAGNLPSLEENYSQGDIANTSIGQGQVLATPVQIANLITTIANDGVAVKPNIVEGLADDNGTIVKNKKQIQHNRVLKVSVAQELKKMMLEVVESGTGQGLQRYGVNGIGGKTGSAETGIYDENGKQLVHSWFAGFFPADEPQYSISVFVENGVTISIPATEIFGEVSAAIMKNKL